MNKSDPAPDTQSANELSFRNAIHLAPLSHINDIVERALEAREAKSVSTSAEQQFEAAVKAVGISLPRFEKRPHLAPISQLFTPVCDQMIESDQLAGSVLRIWAESHKDLRASVEDYAKSNGLPVEGPDFKNRRFRDMMPLKTWNSAIGGITGDGEIYHSPYDVSFMLSMVTGSLPRLIEQAIGAGPATYNDLPFGKWLEELKSSLASPAGTGAAARFVNTASQIVEDSQQEEERISDLIDKSEELCRDFMPELVFLGRELPANPTDSRRTLAGQSERLDNALNLMDQLGTAFEAFRAASSVDYATWDMREQGMKKEAEAANQVHSLIEQLHAALPEPAAPPESDSGTDQQANDETAELDVLRAKCQSLESENEALRAKLFNSDQLIASLRDSNNNTDSPETAPVESVREAVERAQERFGWTELLFCLNGASDVDTEFERPEEVLDALTWLATSYRTGRIGGGMADPAHLLKTACSGWRYAPDNSDMAMNQHPEAYSSMVGGKTYELAHHIGTGVANEERHTIRIAFDWDEEQKMVVVGYIGKHQPSDY